MANIEIADKADFQKLTREIQNLKEKFVATEKEKQKLNILTTADFQKKFGISKVTQWRLRQSGRLPYFTLGRQVFYNVDDLDNVLKS